MPRRAAIFVVAHISALVVRLVLGLSLAMPLAARAADSIAGKVDVALVLVSDVSRSIDDAEFALQKQGYHAAFTDPRVMEAIAAGPQGSIAVTYVEFAGTGQTHTVIDWTVIHDADGAREFAARLAAAPRSDWGATAIGIAIDTAVQLLAESGLDARRRVIDVCGDGTSNQGRTVETARDEAVAAGITINGLAIVNDHPAEAMYAHVHPPGGLPKYYREHVTGGVSSFVLEVHDFKSFGKAMTRKLIDEIASVPYRFAGAGN